MPIFLPPLPKIAWPRKIGGPSWLTLPIASIAARFSRSSRTTHPSPYQRKLPFHGALADLDAEDRLVLASYYLDQRTLSEIGRMLGLHESTVSRRVEKITNRLRKQIVARLTKAGLSRRAAEELLETDVRALEINVREKLAQERRA